jgi:hypothetical protein
MPYRPLFEGEAVATGGITFHDLTSQVAAYSSDYLWTLHLEA